MRARTTKHQKWIELLSFQPQRLPTDVGCQRIQRKNRGRADFDDFRGVKTIDNSTPDLNIKCARVNISPRSRSSAVWLQATSTPS